MKKSLFVTAVICSFLLTGCPKIPIINGTDDTVFQGILYWQNHKVTPKGINVYARFNIDDAPLAQMDQGLDYGISIAKAPPYSYPVDTAGLYAYQNYTVWLYKRSPKCINAAFTARLDGSPLYPAGWDQDPTYDKDPAVGKVLLCVAGAMMRTGADAGGNHGTPGLIAVDDPFSMATIIRFENEHNILFDYDPNKYNATSNNHAHPLLPDPATGGMSSLDIPGPAGRPFELPIDVTAEDGAVIFSKGTEGFALITS